MNDITPNTQERRHRAELREDGRKRLLVTGSRTWPNEPAIAAAILTQWIAWDRPPLTLVHGGAAGADLMAAGVISKQAAPLDLFKVEEHLALWDLHGRAAGHIRNAEMVALGADRILAFIHNGSRGATGCLELAERAMIPTTVYRLDD